MTVRAWFTISALVLVALSVAIVVRLLAPVQAPEILARVDDVRLEGVLVESCWPQRGNDVTCKDGPDEDPETRTLPSSGTLRFIVTYPAQPDDGSIVIEGEGEEIRKRSWDDDIRYELEPGDYTIEAQADYPQDAYVRYRFAFTVTR